MIKRYRKTLLLSSLILSFTSFSANAEDKPLLSGASDVMIANTCAGCHGPKGASTGPSIPTIAGMSSAYLVQTMEGYKSEEIPSTIMGRIAKGYTTEEFEQMGKYFAAQEYVPASDQKSDEAAAKKGAELHDKYCEKCHAEGGTLAEDDSGFLKGQWKSYLAAQLMDYTEGDREAEKKMAKKLKKLNEKHGADGIKALLEYYSSAK